MAKMGNKMIALCSAAIGMIYTSGYVMTQPAASSQTHSVLAAQASKQQSTPSDPTSQSSTSEQVGTTQNTNTTNASSSQKTTTAKQMYKDGTYTGTGTRNIGSVEVAVSIKNDKIVSVDITNCTTSYPESYIKNLPQQVISRQNPDVDVVSGATKSTNDFQDAVTEALQKAKNA